MAEDNGGVELEEFVVSGKSRVLVMGIDRSRLVKELRESKQFQQNESLVSGSKNNQIQQIGVVDVNVNVNANAGALYGIGGGSMPMPMPMPMPGDVWMRPGDSPLSGFPPIFQGGGGPGGMIMSGPRGGIGPPRGMMGIMGIPRGMGVPPIHRPPLGPNSQMNAGGAPNGSPFESSRTEEEELKDLEALLNRKSFKEMQKSKTGEELLDLIHRPTAKETAVAAKFKSKGGSQVKEY
ncbi:hypothetical protein OROMI_007424 [Orobanche minor]